MLFGKTGVNKAKVEPFMYVFTIAIEPRLALTAVCQKKSYRFGIQHNFLIVSKLFFVFFASITTLFDAKPFL